MSGYEKSPDYGGQPPTAAGTAAAIVLAIAIAAAWGWASIAAGQTNSHKVEWWDGDSGTIDGQRFRLSNVDAPETGPVGSDGGALCEAERKLGAKAKAFVIQLSSNSKIEISKDNGHDRYGRRLLKLSVGGRDVGTAGISAGHFRAWPHSGAKSLAPKPDWCG